jgi:transcriptional regulator with XRE-family HTH domain
MAAKLQEQQLQQIAGRLKALRELSDFSLEETAQKLGIPVEIYRAYEEAEMDIPVSILHGAAEMMNVDLTDLLTGAAPRLHSFCLVRQGKGIQVDRYRGYDFQSLAYNFVHRSAEPLMVSVGPEEDENNPLELVTHPGQEFNYVVEGTVRVTLGEHDLVLEKGDSLYFDPTIPHGQRGVKGPAKFLTIIL